jgi:ABC-type multidrug transport system fused ATPase/permease subunit
LNNVSINVSQENKRVVALVGTSGCGKSSIISLIEQFYYPSKGTVFFNGQSTRQIDPKWYHQQVAIVQQEPVLFSGDIRSNIFYGFDTSKYSEPELKAMLDDSTKLASAYDFIHDTRLFPNGYATMVGDRGLKLSGGQKQRIAIARALVRKPKLLLLDEATSALDAESEFQVQQAIDKLIKEGKQTVVVVAHRLSTIKDADEIIVMKEGRVLERGSHTQLLEKEGGYKKLVARQLVQDNAI